MGDERRVPRGRGRPRRARQGRQAGRAASTGLNILGAVSALSPLLAAATPPSPTAGELVPMVVVGGGAVTLGATGRMEVQHVILRGGQLLVTDGLVNPATGSGPTTDPGQRAARRRDRVLVRPHVHQGRPGQADSHPLQGSRHPQQLGQPAAAGRHDRVRPASGVRPQQGLHARRPCRLAGGRPSARLDPARPGRQGQQAEPDLPRGRGRPGCRPGHRQRGHSPGPVPPR